MNVEHTAALREYCRHFKNRQPAEVTMIALDCDGFDVRADGELLRFDFAPPVIDADTARAALTTMAKQAHG
jgi:putative heme iron utilization protein